MASNGQKQVDGHFGRLADIAKRLVVSGVDMSINGSTYTVPKQYQGMQLLVLPLDHGIVWIPTDQQQRMSKLFELKQDHLVPVAAALKGSTDIFYTPYLAKGGSLEDGAVKMATLPHAWMGAPVPVIASAWDEWLPAPDCF